MNYIDKDYYTDTYKGETVSDTDFDKFNVRAQDIVDSLTGYQIPKIGFENFSDSVQELIKKAVCAQIEYFQVEGLEANITGLGQSSGSVSISDFSYSGQASSSRQSGRAAPSCLMYLQGTNLLVKREVTIGII